MLILIKVLIFGGKSNGYRADVHVFDPGIFHCFVFVYDFVFVMFNISLMFLLFGSYFKLQNRNTSHNFKPPEGPLPRGIHHSPSYLYYPRPSLSISLDPSHLPSKYIKLQYHADLQWQASRTTTTCIYLEAMITKGLYVMTFSCWTQVTFSFFSFFLLLFYLSLLSSSFLFFYFLSPMLIKLPETREWSQMNLHGMPPPARMYHTAVCFNNVWRERGGRGRRDGEGTERGGRGNDLTTKLILSL